MEWFLNTDEKVEGPYSEETVKSLVDAGQLKTGCLVWGRGQSDWLPVDRWLQTLTKMAESDNVKPMFNQAWHYAVNGESKGPLSRAELIHELRSYRDKDQILVWTKGMKAWADLFDFHDLLDELNFDRREDTRVDITGTVAAKTDSDRLVKGQLKTVSVGGCGAVGMGSLLQIGNSVTIEVKADAFATPIVTKAQVQYVTDAGFVGFQFDGLNMESKSQVQSYIRMKNAEKSNALKAA